MKIGRMKLTGIVLVLVVAVSLSEGQITLGEFQQRRHAARESLRPGEVMVILTNPESVRNDGGSYLYRPDSDFWYLTGFGEPGSALILAGERITYAAGNDKVSGTEFLFLREPDPHSSLYEGQGLGVEASQEVLGVENSASIANFTEALTRVLRQAKVAYLNLSWSDALPPQEALAAAILQLLPAHPDIGRGPFRRGRSLLSKLFRRRDKMAAAGRKVDFHKAGEILNPMRLEKSGAELDLMRKAIAATGDGLLTAMRQAKHGLYEYQLQASVEFAFTDNGAERKAFPSIIASGPNALTLHYRDNRRQMESGDLVLMDVGAEYGMYAADITRTVPVNGRFSVSQREIYGYVLAAQEAAMAALKPGVTIRELHIIAADHLTANGYGRYFRHGVSHYLGLDVHDVGKRNLPLAPGMVITIEPGLYIPSDDDSVAQEYRGIGVRIEDDFLITEDGYIHLSRGVPRSIADIEELMK